MLMNNGVDMNNVMMIWGELYVLMIKCNYQRKEQCSPMKKNNIDSIKALFPSNFSKFVINPLKLLPNVALVWLMDKRALGS